MNFCEHLENSSLESNKTFATFTTLFSIFQLAKQEKGARSPKATLFSVSYTMNLHLSKNNSPIKIKFELNKCKIHAFSDIFKLKATKNYALFATEGAGIWWVFLCFSKARLCLYLLSQKSQAKGKKLATWNVFRCSCCSFAQLKVRLHSWQ